MILGVDVGTTAVKAVLLNGEGHIVGQGSHPHELRCPHAGWAEEDPEDWWGGLIEATRAALSGHEASGLRAIGVSGMVPAIILLDPRGRVLRPSIQQNDARAMREIETLGQRFSSERLFAATGGTWNQQVVGPKLLWIQRNEPGIWERVDRIIGSYEYIGYRLTSARYCEANWALESGLWDVHREDWIEELIDAVHIGRHQLAPIRRCSDLVGRVSRRAAAETGLPAGTPVIAGSADHIASILPSGSTRAGHVVVKLGGAGDLLLTVDAFRPVRDLYIDHHCVPGLYVINGCMATSGSILKWFARDFAAGRPFAELDQEAASVAPGSDGMVTLPYFLGEKTPIHDPLARGTLVGLTLSHRRPHVYRSLLEGVAFAFRHHVDVLRSAGHRIATISVVDGGSSSDLWCEILASVLEHPLRRPQSAQIGSALGVALVAGVSIGIWNWDNMAAPHRTGDTFLPDTTAAATYRRLYAVYRQTYEQLRSLYPRLAGPEEGDRSLEG